MARAVRFTKPERDVLRLLLETSDDLLTKAVQRNAAESALKKIELSEFALAKKRRTGITWQEAIESFRGVLGNRLVVPRNPGNEWYAQMARGLARSNYTVDDCREIAEAARVEWQGPIKALSLINQGDVLLSGATSTAGSSRGVQTDLEDL